MSGAIAFGRMWRVSTFQVGVSSGGGLPVLPHYPTQRAMSALVANPWFWTGVQAISTDLSGLPLIAIRNGEQLEDHWLRQLLMRPNPAVSGLLYRKQQYADLAGRRLGEVTQISEDTSFEGGPIPYAAERMAADAAGSSVPIEAGSQQVSVNADISWELV